MLRVLTALALLFAPALGRAVESEPVSSPRATVTLVSAVAAVAPGEPFRIALRQRLAPGWHTYWSNPGDAGAPTELTLALPLGSEATPLAFPAPKRIAYGPLVSFGYEGEVLFPLTVTPPASLRPGERFAVEAKGAWLVCETVCIPEEGEFRLDLPVEARPRPAATAALLLEAEAALPRPSPFAVSIGFEGPSGALRLAGEGIAPGAVREAFFFPSDWGVLDHAAPQPLRVEAGALVLGLARGTAPLPDRLSGLVAITDAAGVRSAYAVSAAPGPLPASIPGSSPGAGMPAVGLGSAVLLALLGGLLLNLMPCVFPILAMKAIGIARLSGAARAEVRAEALAYTAGVVLSFLALGGALVLLRAAGVAAGWGFQFTSPAVVAALAWLMLAVGLNLSGVYAVSLPVGLDQGAVARGGRAGAFFTGALAVLVATPCTAPFMATAIGAAAVMPPAATLAVFGALSLGMAAPSALFALAPGLARRLPRPGAWMERLRQGLAFPMYAAAAWLVWVLAQGAGADAVLWALLGGVLLGFGLWAVGVAQRAGRGRALGRAVALAAALLLAALLPRVESSRPETTTTAALTTLSGAEPWSPARVEALRGEGRPVFVNVTAAWCISCKVNERIALDTETVRRAFAARRVAVLVGDWTRGDAELTALLRAHGRDGVPLYLFYPEDGGPAVVLPQLLTEGIVLEAIGALPGPVARAARVSSL